MSPELQTAIDKLRYIAWGDGNFRPLDYEDAKAVLDALKVGPQEGALNVTEMALPNPASRKTRETSNKAEPDPK